MTEVQKSWATSEGVRRSMRSNKGRDTLIELRVRKQMFALGYRYRVNHRPLQSLRRTADIVFTRARVAIFVDGCFWHGCSLHYSAPKANGDFWSLKVSTNIRRDDETNRLLADAGWTVLRFWEHEPNDAVVSSIVEHIDKRRRTYTVAPPSAVRSMTATSATADTKPSK